MNNLISTDAEVLLAIKENDNFGSKNSVIEVILSDTYLTLNNLNTSLNRLFSAGLINISDEEVSLSDKGKIFTCGYIYNKRNDFLEKLKSDICSITFNDYIVKNFVTSERYKLATKVSKKVKRQVSDDKTLVNETLLYLCYVLIMFFTGFGIGFIFGGNVLGGLFIVPASILLSIVLYIKTKTKIKSQKQGFDVFSFVKKPVIISIIVNSLVAVFSIVAFVIWDVSYFFAILIEIIIIAILWVYTSAIAKESISNAKYKTKYFCAKIYTDNYFIGGVNILDDNERVLQENVFAQLINPETNNIIFETQNVYKTVVNGRQIFYATVTNGDSRIIYFLRKTDVISAVHLISEIDFVKSANCEKTYLTELVKNEEKNFDCKYSDDGLVRAYSCILEGKSTIVLEYLDYSSNDNGFDDFRTWLTDDVISSPYFKISWNRVLTESFDLDNSAEEFLNKLITEITFEDLVINLFSQIG